MGYTLGQAARAVGRSKTTILRSLRNGTISARKNVHGQWDIDPAELHHVYPAVPRDTEMDGTDGTVANTEQNARIRDLEAQVAELRHDRDAWRDQAQRLALARPESARSWWRRLVG